MVASFFPVEGGSARPWRQCWIKQHAFIKKGANASRTSASHPVNFANILENSGDGTEVSEDQIAIAANGRAEGWLGR
jgi:hypothetical protein